MSIVMNFCDCVDDTPTKKPEIFFGVDERIFRNRCSDRVAVDEQRPLVVVDLDVEKRLAVARPFNAAARVGNFIGEIFARRQIANPDRVKFRTLVVGRVGEKLVIAGMRGVAEIPVAFAGRFGIPVEQDLGIVRRAAARHAAELRILPTFDEAREVFVGTVRLRDLAVVLFQARFHFLKQRLLQRLGACQHRFRVGVFGFEMRTDAGIEQRRLAHDLLPVLRPQPAVVVGQRNAVVQRSHRNSLRNRRHRRSAGFLGSRNV